MSLVANFRRAVFYWFVSLAVTQALAAPLQLLSLRQASQPAPATANGDSYASVLSPDGRYVLFASTANNLLLTTNGHPIPVLAPPRLNVYLRDRTNGTLALASMNLSGVGGGNGDSMPFSLSTNARYALFESSASDLVPGDTNNATDIFVRDLVSGTTLLVSVSTNGGVANGLSRGSLMTPDGRYVAFVSEASNLVAGDTNKIADVFLRDLQSEITTLISTNAKQTNSVALSVGSESPDITPDGRYVAFFSTATNLVPGIVTSGEIYIRDVIGGTTVCASTYAHTIMPTGGGTSAISYNHIISADGTYVAFEASRSPASSVTTPGVILRFGLQTSLTDVVNTNANVATSVGYPDIHNLSMTPDGCYIAFVGNTNSGSTAIYVWDAQSGATYLVSGDLSNSVPASSTCDWPLIDPTGRYVAFLSSATNLVTNSIAGGRHIYMRDRETATTTLVDAQTNAAGSSIGPLTVPKMSDDAQRFAFESLDNALTPNDGNHAYDVFVRDLSTNAIELISARHSALPSLSPAGSSAGGPLALSADGRFVAFSSEADNLVADDTNGMRDIFLRDVVAGTNLLASVSTNGTCPDGPSAEPAISANGLYIAFSSTADNLVPWDNNRVQDVFLRDVQSGATTLVSVDASGFAPGDKASYSPAISPDGRYVLFRSKATNLGPGPFSGLENLFLRDLQLALTYTLSTNGVLSSAMTSDGRVVGSLVVGGNLSVWDLQNMTITVVNLGGGVGGPMAISLDGQRIAFFSGPSLRAIDLLVNSNFLIASPVPGLGRVGLRFTADSRFLAYGGATASYVSQQVFIYDFDTRSNLLVSQSFDGTGGGQGNSDSAVMSTNGRFVVYRSSATNLISFPNTNSAPNIFLYDRLNGTTTLLTASEYSGGFAGNRSLEPVLSADGRTLIFQSWASDLVPLDFNQGSDLFLLNFLYATITLGLAGQGPTITWPTRPGESYHVQFKNGLSDNDWQEVTGTVTVNGSQAQLTDLAPTTGQRLYRVAAF